MTTWSTGNRTYLCFRLLEMLPAVSAWAQWVGGQPATAPSKDPAIPGGPGEGEGGRDGVSHHQVGGEEGK